MQEGEQEPISLVGLYQAHGIDLNIDVSLSNKGALGWTPAMNYKRDSFEDGTLEDNDPYDLPLIYVGGHQVIVLCSRWDSRAFPEEGGAV